MLSAHLATTPARAPWIWSDGRYISGSSWIRPYDHPALEVWAVSCTEATAMMVRERQPRLSARTPMSPLPMPVRVYHDAVQRASTWPAAHLLIEHKHETGTITVTTGERATAPVFFTVHRGSLHIDWDLSRLADVHLTGAPLDPEETARRITLALHYTHHTVYRDAYMLTERATARFHDGQLAFHWPHPCLRDEARELADGAPVIDAYTSMLAATLADRHYTAKRTGIELSGGLDSANVALSMAELHGPGLVSGAVIHPGPAGTQQERRRGELVEHTGLRDYTVGAAAYPPLNPASPHRPAPQEETYLDAHASLLAQWRDEGILYAATGVGGDEMLSLPATGPVGDGEILPDWLGPTARAALEHSGTDRLTPTPPVSDSVLLAMAAGAPMYLRAGVWPLYPLADPDLFRFGQWLPPAWRRAKRLARARLEAEGFSRDVVRPPLRESFTPLLTTGMARFGPGRVQQLLDEGSPLIDAGFLDPDRLPALKRRMERELLAPEDLQAAHALRLHDALTVYRRTPAFQQPARGATP